MSQSYWNRVLNRRVGRRRALVASGGAAAAAAFLVACGGDDGGGTGTTGSAAGSTSPTGATDATGATGGTATGGSGSILTPITDSTSEMVRGGSGVWSHATPVSLDPHLTGGQVAHGWHAYSQLFRIDEGYMENASGEFTGELAESWEFSPDRTELTVKLKQGVLFAPTAPVNGREMTSADVVFSWQRYSAISPRRAELANEHNPSAPVLSIDAIDDYTIVIKLQQPLATILGGFAGNLPGTPYVVPVEADGQLDLQGESNGTGAFYLAEYEPGFRARYIANPGFKVVDERELPYIDEMEYVALPDYPAFLAQFKAGQVLDAFFGVVADDVLQTKADVPQLEVYDSGLARGQVRTLFGHVEESPFKDERVRQAVSMTWDRDLFTEVAFGTKRFEDVGIPIDKPYDSAIPAGAPCAYTGWWLDPQGADFGPNAMYYTHNLDEATKLIEAAGLTTPIETTVTWGDAFPPFFQARREILMGMLDESGLFRLTQNQISFANEWNPQFRANKGQFNGLAMTLDVNELDTAYDLYGHYNSGGSFFFGNDETLEDLTAKMIREFDDDARRALAHELQRHEAKVNWLPAITSATTIRIGWPAERNRRVWRGSENRWHAHIWLDRTKPPYA